VRKLVGDPLAMFRLAARYASALEGANGNVAAAVVRVDRREARCGHRVAGRDPHGKNRGFAAIGKRVQHRDCAEIVDVGVNVGVEDEACLSAWRRPASLRSCVEVEADRQQEWNAVFVSLRMILRAEAGR
jgi:hypothetical protein